MSPLMRYLLPFGSTCPWLLMGCETHHTSHATEHCVFINSWYTSDNIPTLSHTKTTDLVFLTIYIYNAHGGRGYYFNSNSGNCSLQYFDWIVKILDFFHVLLIQFLIRRNRFQCIGILSLRKTAYRVPAKGWSNQVSVCQLNVKPWFRVPIARKIGGSVLPLIQTTWSRVSVMVRNGVLCPINE